MAGSQSPSTETQWTAQSVEPVEPVETLEDASGDELDRFARLESLVRSLVTRFEALGEERNALRAELDAREHRVRELEEELRQANQLRQDVGKRVDDLLTQLDGIVGDEASG